MSTWFSLDVPCLFFALLAHASRAPGDTLTSLDEPRSPWRVDVLFSRDVPSPRVPVPSRAAMGLLRFLGGVRRLRRCRDRGEGDAAAASPPGSSDPSVPPDGASPLLASSAEVLPAIVAHLGGHALASLASTCRELRRATSGDGDVGAATYWRALCEGALGEDARVDARARGRPRRDVVANRRRLLAKALRRERAPDRAAHWHAETALEAWTSVYDQDEARRMRAFDGAEAANGHDPGPPAWGPDTRRNHPATATHPHRPAPESEDARAEAARLALSARAPSACPLLTRSGTPPRSSMSSA